MCAAVLDRAFRLALVVISICGALAHGFVHLSKPHIARGSWVPVSLKAGWAQFLGSDPKCHDASNGQQLPLAKLQLLVPNTMSNTAGNLTICLAHAPSKEGVTDTPPKSDLNSKDVVFIYCLIMYTNSFREVHSLQNNIYALK